jgi:hypothetical protein
MAAAFVTLVGKGPWATVAFTAVVFTRPFMVRGPARAEEFSLAAFTAAVADMLAALAFAVLIIF